MKRQRGVALLAVALLLAVVGALAFVMSRQGAMAANGVNAQYDAQQARYFAEAGVNVAKWRAGQVGCGRRDTLVKASRIDASGTYSAFIKNGDKKLNIDAVGETGGGARATMSRTAVINHEKDPREAIIGSDKGFDTFISAAAPQAVMDGQQFLELTQGVSHALVQFDLPDDMLGALIVRAELTLTQYQSNSVLPAQVVSAHRLTRKWEESGASWVNAGLLSGWANAGADYTAPDVASVTINGNSAYTWDLTAMADGWANAAFSNYGVLLRADGPLQQARFYGLQSAQGKPTLRVIYHRAC